MGGLLGGASGISTAVRFRIVVLYVALALTGLGSLALFGWMVSTAAGRQAASGPPCGVQGRHGGGLYTLRLGSGAVSPLVTGVAVDHAAVSPDGKQVAFLAGGGILARLHMCDLAHRSTTQPRIPVPASNYPLSWAPSAHSLLFLGGDLTAQGADQKPFLLSLRGGTTRQLGGEAPWYWDGAAISPDGKTLALLLQWKYPHGHEPEQLALYDVASGRLERLAGSSQVAEIDALSWAPDGRRIVFAAYRGNPHGALYVVDVATRRVTPLLIAGAGAQEPAWSPDGRTIAFVRPGRRRSIWLLDLRSGAVRHAARGYAPAWAPDGRSLLFARP